jgi:hypothetical protein
MHQFLSAGKMQEMVTLSKKIKKTEDISWTNRTLIPMTHFARTVMKHSMLNARQLIESRWHFTNHASTQQLKIKRYHFIKSPGSTITPTMINALQQISMQHRPITYHASVI